MILKDLVLQVPFKSVFAEIVRLKKEKGKKIVINSTKPKYRLVYDGLKLMEASINSDAGSVTEYISHLQRGSNIFYHQFVPWSEWLGMEVEESTLKSLSESTILAYCIIEMTMYGFDETIAKQNFDEEEAKLNNFMSAASSTSLEFDYYRDDRDLYFARYQQEKYLYPDKEYHSPYAKSTTYKKLKATRDKGKLIPGAWYRITDYKCTTTQPGTKSAGHVFDIVVRAFDNCLLEEKGYAKHHENDSYFKDCIPESWKIWYCLDNDDTRFAWADTENGKGVIYRMIDEWNNDVPYDFKNIMFKRAKDNKQLGYADYPYFIIPTDDTECDGNEVIYVYTFNGINETNGKIKVVDRSLKEIVNIDEEASLIATHYGPINIKIGTYDQKHRVENYQRVFLNNIVFLQVNKSTFLYDAFDGCLYCTFETGCCNITIGARCCYGLHFGVGCCNIQLGVGCYNNQFGNQCSSIKLGYGSSRNFFGSDCGGIWLSHSCINNNFGNNTRNCDLGKECNDNTVGSHCREINLQPNCSDLTIGNHCKNITFEQYCKDIIAHNNVGHCIVKGGSAKGEKYTQNAQILSGTLGDTTLSELKIEFAANKNYTQFAGLNSKGKLKIWVPADFIK